MTRVTEVASVSLMLTWLISCWRLAVIRLTERQREVLRFLSAFQAEHDYPAIVTDIQHRFEVSYSSALSVAHRLEELGFLDILRERRAIRGLFVLHKE